MKGNEMNKIISALVAGLFAVSVNAFAADAAPKADVPPAPHADATKLGQAPAEKPAAPAPKHTKKHAKKAAPKAAPKADAAKPAEAAPAK
jgi:hypothetical protein